MKLYCALLITLCLSACSSAPTIAQKADCHDRAEKKAAGKVHSDNIVYQTCSNRYQQKNHDEKVDKASARFFDILVELLD